MKKEGKETMSKFYDISKKITNETPTIKITENLICSINNRKNTLLCVAAMMEEKDRKNEQEGGEENTEQEFEKMQKVLSMLLGNKNAELIEEMDLPINEYTELFKSIMAIARGVDPEEENEENTP